MITLEVGDAGLFGSVVVDDVVSELGAGGDDVVRYHGLEAELLHLQIPVVSVPIVLHQVRNVHPLRLLEVRQAVLEAPS